MEIHNILNVKYIKVYEKRLIVYIKWQEETKKTFFKKSKPAGLYHGTEYIGTELPALYTEEHELVGKEVWRKACVYVALVDSTLTKRFTTYEEAEIFALDIGKKAFVTPLIIRED